jgi:hypothetical protein
VYAEPERPRFGSRLRTIGIAVMALASLFLWVRRLRRVRAG